MTQKQSQRQADTERSPRATDPIQANTQPTAGEAYRCTTCGMELKITSDCHCPDADDVRLECCGQELMRL